MATELTSLEKAGITAGTGLVKTIAEQQAARERQKIQNEMDRRKNLIDSLKSGSNQEAMALNNMVSQLARALA